MNKVIALVGLICVVGSLVGCGKSTEEATSSYILPDGLKDCKIFYMSSGMINHITVVRCPLSSTTTTYNEGKTTRSVSVIEDTVEINGEMYKKIPN